MLLTFKGHQGISALFPSTWMSTGTSSLRYPRACYPILTKRGCRKTLIVSIIITFPFGFLFCLKTFIDWFFSAQKFNQVSCPLFSNLSQSPIQLVWNAFAPPDSTLPLDDRLPWVRSSSLIWVVAITLIWFLCLYSLWLSVLSCLHPSARVICLKHRSDQVLLLLQSVMTIYRRHLISEWIRNPNLISGTFLISSPTSFSTSYTTSPRHNMGLLFSVPIVCFHSLCPCLLTFTAFFLPKFWLLQVEGISHCSYTSITTLNILWKQTVCV